MPSDERPEGMLIVCATPIGNLEDVSERLRDNLVSADVVYAEDTRRARKLLDHVGASTRLRSLFAGNEARRSEELIEDVRAGQKVALVSDAGMPSISDPGARAVAMAHAEGLAVGVVPGPSAVTAAVAASGFGGDRFVFEGFLPRRGRERSERIEALAGEPRAVVLFASPKRLGDDLADLAAALGPERRVAVARELTKVHEEVWVGSLADSVRRWAGDVRGEVTVVLEGEAPAPADVEGAVERAREMVSEGMTVSDAARSAAAGSGVSRRVVYQRLIADQGDRS